VLKENEKDYSNAPSQISWMVGTYNRSLTACLPRSKDLEGLGGASVTHVRRMINCTNYEERKEKKRKGEAERRSSKEPYCTYNEQQICIGISALWSD